MLLVLTVLCARGKKDPVTSMSPSDCRTPTTARDSKKVTQSVPRQKISSTEFDVFKLAISREPETPETDLKSLATADYNVLANPVIQRKVFGLCEHRTQDQEKGLLKTGLGKNQDSRPMDTHARTSQDMHVEEHTQRSNKSMRNSDERGGVVTNNPKIMISCMDANGEQSTAKPATNGFNPPHNQDVGGAAVLMEHNTQVEYATPFEQRTQMELAAPPEKENKIEYVAPIEQKTQIECFH
ncbi:hypothetical protein Aduo_005371 [Ancylostoma duodenale]